MNRLLEIGKNSIMTYQYALNVASHNITNAGDEDFSRQEANITSYAPHAYEPYPHYWGSGAMINSLDRAYSESIDRNMREAFTSVEYNKKRSDLLALIEARVNEPGELGVSLLANEFLNSFDQLAANPTSYPLRSNVVYTAERLSDQFKHVYDGFDELSADVVHDATETVEAINRLTEKIQLTLKELNRTKNESTKRNDLLDERDAAIRELSQLAEVKVVHNEDGRVSVSIDGVHAVDQSFRAEFKLEAQDDRLYVYTERDEFTPRVFGGKLGALIKVYEEDIPQQKEALLRWGDALVSNVNEIHQTGYSLHDPPKTNVEFFSDFREGKMVMNQFLKDDRNWIATSADGLEGNNEIALAIADLKDEKIVDGLTLSGKYAEIISDLGDAIDLSDDASEGYQLTLDHLKHERDSYSGVSLDEEMIDMITYQRSYEASAKIIKIADELLLTLINMV